MHLRRVAAGTRDGLQDFAPSFQHEGAHKPMRERDRCKAECSSFTRVFFVDVAEVVEEKWADRFHRAKIAVLLRQKSARHKSLRSASRSSGEGPG